MKPSRARAVTYGVTALLVAVALRYTPRLPDRAGMAPDGTAAEGTLQQQGAPASPAQPLLHVDTLARGESLIGVLARGGVSEMVAREALRAAKSLDMRRIPAGMPVTVRTASADSAPSEIVLQLGIDRLLHLTRGDSGWSQREEVLPWTTDTVVVAGTIRSTLYDAMDDAARALMPASVRQQLTWSLADIFEYRVDMSRDLQVGDRFRALVERRRSPAGATRLGNILAADFTLSGNEIQAVRFKDSYFDQNGKSLRAAFLRAPLEFRRISSVFGLRFHPILGIWRGHKGTDYAASSGTPVRAIGDGTVIRASWSHGYGNLLEIRHPNGYVTRYGHLRAFARGIHAGSRVGIGQTVGYVGMTGLATGPHLHFEVLVNGVQRDPRVALRDRTGFLLAASQRPAFEATRQKMIAALDVGAPTQLASRTTN